MPHRKRRSPTYSSFGYSSSLSSDHLDASRHRTPQKRFRPLTVAKWLVLPVIVLIAIFGANKLLTKHQSDVKVAKIVHQTVATTQVTLAADTRQKTFTSEVNAIIAANSQITFGIATDNAVTGLQTYGSTAGFDGASDGKLLTASDYLHHVELGEATLSQQIDGQSAESLLQAMIVVSDDTAWAELNDYLTHSDLASYAASIGFNNYDTTMNTFPASDVASLMNKLYAGTLLNSADRSLFLGYLKLANYRTFVVPAIPGQDTIYHKIGLDVDEVNDAAIITNASRSFELVIMTNGNGTYEWSNRALIMQQIAKDALTAFLPNA
jgi:beta-lactamase class A